MELEALVIVSQWQRDYLARRVHSMTKEKECYLKAVGNTAKGKNSIPLRDLQIEYQRQQELTKVTQELKGGKKDEI